MPPALSQPTWPFDVRRVPFFYGWVVCVVSTLGFYMSIPGQTMGMAVFTDPFIEAFGLSRTQLSVAYLFGTVASSLFLTRAGRLYDRIGARKVMVGSSLALGVCVVVISFVDVLIAGARQVTGLSTVVVGFPLMLLCYFGIRFTGQGVLTSASRNVLLVWFEKRRGLVSGVRGVFVSLGFSLAPLPLGWLIVELGWRSALHALAAAVAIGFGLLAALLVRDNPEECGLLPDGELHEDRVVEATPRYPDHTMAEARRSVLFWIYAGSLGVYSMLGTAITFHIAAIFAEFGRGREEAFGYFFPMAMVSTSVNLLASWLADFYRLKPFLLVMIAGWMLGAWGLLHLDLDWGYWAMVAGNGTGAGLWGVLSSLAFVRFFGRRHLGEVSGLNAAISVFASAIGPALFSLGEDAFGTYRAAAWLCLALLAVFLITAIAVPQREPTATSS